MTLPWLRVRRSRCLNYCVSRGRVGKEEAVTETKESQMSEKHKDVDVSKAKAEAENGTDRPNEKLFDEERKQFRALVVGNPNYFGNLKASPFKPIQVIVSNRT